MTILIDTDVLVDVALGREPHALASGELLSVLERGHATGFIAWHSLSNFHYLLTSVRGSSQAREFLRDLLLFVDVAPTSTASAAYAMGLLMRDFEDALSGVGGGCLPRRCDCHAERPAITSSLR